MANDTEERIVITAEAGQALQAYDKIRAAILKNEATQRNIAKVNKELSREQLAALERIINKNREYRKELETAEKRLEQLGLREKSRVSNINAASNAMGRYNFQIMGVAGAIDDFITVSSLQDWSMKGMIAGMSAAANNVSMVLAMTNPWLGIVPPIITAFTKLGYAFLGAGDDAEESADKMSKLKKQTEQVMEALKKYRMEELARKEGPHAANREQMRQRHDEENAAIAAEQSKLKADEEEIRKMPERIGFGFGPAPANAFDNVRNKRNALLANQAEQRKKEQERLALLEGQKQEEAKANRDDRLEDIQKLRPNIDPLIIEMVKKGMAPEAIKKNVAGILGANFNGQPGANNALNFVIWEGRKKALELERDEIEGGKGPLWKISEDARKRADEANRAAREAALDDNMNKREKEKFRKTAARMGLEADKAEDAAQREIEANKSDLSRMIQKQDEIIQKLNDLLVNPPPITPDGNR